MKILIIDDSVVALEVAKTRLAKECLDILCAEGGVAGLEIAGREKPDLILLDVNMPGLSGFDVCRTLKADPELCMIPVLFLSGSGTAEDKVKGLDLGAVDYITKPFDAFELRARVRATLRTKHLQDLLIEHAHLDPLTGLPNRRALMRRLQREWARIERHGSQLSFVMADIDHFKRVNDVYGHQAGDVLLQAVASVIAQQCRKVDLPARYGGEEFAIVMAGEPASAAVHFANHCREEIAKVRVAANGDTVAVTASFGVAHADNLPSPEVLMRRADGALYRAKQAGRNRVCACDNDQERSADSGSAGCDAAAELVGAIGLSPTGKVLA
jgi:two-component system, cell cycle response regulator